MDTMDHILGELIWDEDVNITSFIDTHVISGMLPEIGPGAMEITVQPGHYKIAGTEYIFAGETITLTTGNTLIWVDNTAVIQQGTVQPASGTILLAVVEDNTTSITNLDVSPLNVMYQVMQIYTSNLEANSGVSRTQTGIDYVSNNLLIDNDSLKESLENIDIAIGNRTYTEENVIANGDIATDSLNKLDLKFGDLASTDPGEGASLIGVEDVSNIIASSTVEGALQEIFNDFITHNNSSAGVHGVSGNIVGTQGNQTLQDKVLDTPTIGNFTNAQHDHSSSSQGGIIDASVINNLSETVQDIIGGTFLNTPSIEFDYSDAGNTISANVLEAGINHDSLNGFDPNRHLTEGQMSLENIGQKRHSFLTNIGADDHHSELHTIASHTDTAATGTQLNTLTEGSNADALHTHTISGVVDFSESVQDIVGTMINDTLTIEWAYDDPSNTLSANVVESNLVHDNLAGFNSARHLLQSEMSLLSIGQREHSMLSNIGADDHHSELHTIASHTDTTATGTQLNTLTDGSNADALHTHSTFLGIDEVVQDIVGGMVSGNTESDIVVSYDDGAGKLNFSIEDHYLRNDQDTSTNFVVTAKEFGSKEGIRIYDPSPGIANILIKAPTGFSNYVLTLPSTNGDVGQILSTDGSGVTSWVDAFDPESPPAIGNTTPNEIFSTDIHVKESLLLEDDDNNFIEIKAPVNVGSDYELVLPSYLGSIGDILVLDSSQHLTWMNTSSFLSDIILQNPGDMIVRDDGNTTINLAAGAEGKVLKSRGINKSPSWQDYIVRNLTANGKVRIIADRGGVSAAKTDGNCIITNNVGAKITRIEIDINQLNDGDLDPSGDYYITFSSGQNHVNQFSYPVVSVIDRSQVTDGDPPTLSFPFNQYVATEDINDGIRARLVGLDRIKISGLENRINWGTIILQF